jgi:hypothetical protein
MKFAMPRNRTAHMPARPKSAANAPLHADAGILPCPTEDILAVVRALAKRAAREDHAREAVQNQETRFAAGELS